MTTTLTREAKTEDGTTAIRITAHHGNTWMILESEERFYIVELAPDIDITEFHAHITPSGLGQPKYHILDGAQLINGSWLTADDRVNLETRIKAEGHIKTRLRRKASHYVSRDHLSYYDAVRGFAAVMKKYERWLSFDNNADYGPKLVQNWSLTGEPSAWAVVWEEGSPDYWAEKWGSARREDPRGLFMEPLCSFALGVYAGD